MIPAALASTAGGLICIAVQITISEATTSSCLCWEPGFPALEAHLPWGLTSGSSFMPACQVRAPAGCWSVSGWIKAAAFPWAAGWSMGTPFCGTAGSRGTQLWCRAGRELCCRAASSTGTRRICAQDSFQGSAWERKHKSWSPWVLNHGESSF